MTDKHSASRIPSLDGVRAIAVFFTIGHHLLERYIVVSPKPVIDAFNRCTDGVGIMFTPDKTGHANSTIFHYAIALANLVIDSFNRSGDGVGIFFVLSGFLITTLLLKEHDKTGKCGLFDFYLRRTFRILPPLYAYLIVFAVFCSFKGLNPNWPALFSAAVFYQDYSSQANAVFWGVQHTWSLCVEEQFYLLWPLIFLFSLRLGGKKAAAGAAGMLILLTPVLRIATKISNFALFEHRENFMLHTRMDALMCGCLVALLIGNPSFEAFYNRAAKYWWLAVFYIFFLSGFLNVSYGFMYTNSVGLTIDSFCIAFVILWVSRNPASAVGKILNARFMVVAGVLSYSAYLWQTFFIYYDQHTVIAPWLTTIPMRLVLISAAALTSYLLIEKPAISIRKAIQNALASRREKRMSGLAGLKLETGDTGNI